MLMLHDSIIFVALKKNIFKIHYKRITMDTDLLSLEDFIFVGAQSCQRVLVWFEMEMVVSKKFGKYESFTLQNMYI